MRQCLTKRLEAVYHLIQKDHIIADIGTDHGYLAAALVEGHKAEKVIASDVNKGPLESAKAHIASCHLEHVVDCRLGDGLQTLLPGEAPTVVLCGMGGFLMMDLLEEGPYWPEHLVVQPQNGFKEFKRFLWAHGYHVEKEILVEDMGHLYEAWRYSRNKSSAINPYESLEEDHILWEVGALLFESGHPLWKDRVKQYINIDESILAAMRPEGQKSQKYVEVERHKRALEVVYEDYCKRHS